MFLDVIFSQKKKSVKYLKIEALEKYQLPLTKRLKAIIKR